MLIRCLVQKEDYSYLCMWTISNCLARKETIRCGKYSTNKSNWGEPTSFLDHVYLGCSQRRCETSKHIVDNYRTTFESRISAGTTGKITMLGNTRIFLHGPTTWKVMPKSACNDIANWRTKLQNNCTKYQLHALMTPIQRRRIEFRERIVRNMRTNCSQMSISDTNWWTGYYMVSQQTCTCDNKVDQSL